MIEAVQLNQGAVMQVTFGSGNRFVSDSDSVFATETPRNSRTHVSLDGVDHGLKSVAMSTRPSEVDRAVDSIAAQIRTGHARPSALIDLAERLELSCQRALLPSLARRDDMTQQGERLGALVERAVEELAPSDLEGRARAVFSLFHHTLRIAYDPVGDGSPFPVLTSNRVSHGGSYCAADVLLIGHGLCQEKQALLRSMLLMADVPAELELLGDPDGAAETLGTHMQLVLTRGEHQVSLDTDRAWCPGKKYNHELLPSQLFSVARERAKAHGFDRKLVGDIAYRDLDRSNYAMFAAFAQLEGLAPVGLKTLSAGVEACDRALRSGCGLVEVAAVRSLVALAQIEALEGQSGTHHMTTYLKDDAVNRARVLLGQADWKAHERVQLLGLLAEAMSIRGDQLDRVASETKKVGARCATPTTLQFYASSRPEHAATMRKALGLEAAADKADFPLPA
ncbi:MAG: hypothetical protein AAGJ56_01985 [Myxococcota bacterium]